MTKEDAEVLFGEGNSQMRTTLLNRFDAAIDSVSNDGAAQELADKNFENLKNRKLLIDKLRASNLCSSTKSSSFDTKSLDVLVNEAAARVHDAIAKDNAEEIDRNLNIIADVTQHFDCYSTTLHATKKAVLKSIRGQIDTVHNMVASRDVRAVCEVVFAFVDKCPTIRGDVLIEMDKSLMDWCRRQGAQSTAELNAEFLLRAPDVMAALPRFSEDMKHAQFAEAFRAGGLQNITPQTIVDRIYKGKNPDDGSNIPLSPLEKATLLSALEQYNGPAFEQMLTTKYLSGANEYATLALAKRELEKDIAIAVKNTKNNMCNAPDLLNLLAVAYCVVHVPANYLTLSANAKSEKRILPHLPQYAAIFRLLGLDQIGDDGFLNNVWSSLKSLGRRVGAKAGVCEKVKVNHFSDFKCNHLAQILTGEGKSIALGILAAFLALLNFDVDVVCYSEYLSERDAKDLQGFHDFLNVTDKIHYMTFLKLCSDRVEQTRARASELVALAHTNHKNNKNNAAAGLAPAPPRPGSTASPAAYGGPSSSASPAGSVAKQLHRILLIDEVDVFFSNDFYGNTYDAGVPVRGPEVSALINHIYVEWKQHGRNLSATIHDDPLFKAVLDRYHSELHPALRSVARTLCANVERVFDAKTKRDYKVDLANKKIGYKDGDKFDWSAVYPNETVFLYIDEFGFDGFPHDRNDDTNPIALDLYCGMFSFAEMPSTSGYESILGVTGTLETVDKEPGGTKILEEYKFNQRTFIPTMWNKIFHFTKNTSVAVLPTANDWIERIKRQVDEDRAEKRAVIIYFENEAMLKLYEDNVKNVAHQKLVPNMSQDKREQVVAVAVSAETVTLAVREYGRGVDFRPRQNTEFVVIQTFLSETLSEEEQIKGRTARQGKKGHYHLLMCQEHLEKNFGIDVNTVNGFNGDGALIYNYLGPLREIKMQAMSDERVKRRTDAAAKHKAALDLERVLLDDTGAITRGQKIAKLSAATTCTATLPRHYTCILDTSLSMGDGIASSWGKLCEAFEKYVLALRAQQQTTGVPITISVVVFASDARIHIPVTNVDAVPLLRADAKPMNGGTNFAAAFATAIQALQLAGFDKGERAGPILFLTDGQGADGCAQVAQLLQIYGKSVTRMDLIGFACADPHMIAQLQNIKSVCDNHGCPCEITPAEASGNKLEEIMVATTNNNVIRRGA